MAFFTCGIVLAAASSVLVPAHSGHTPTGRLQQAKAPQYTAQQAEFYLSAQDISYVRPGFNVKLVNLSNVAPGQKPVVEITYTDDMGQPLDYAGKSTPGPLSISFILAWYDASSRQYTTYTTRTRSGVTSPSADQGGTWQHIETGHSKYTFGTTLPATMDVTKTTTLTIYGRRTLTDIIGKDYYLDNINYDFRPDGQPVTEVWAAMDVAKTCNNCHDPLSAHGGTRRNVKTCVQCHTPQIPPDATTGNTFDFKVMIHKIHDGENLPSVVAGGKYGFGTSTDFSTVAYPQDIRNCATCHRADSPEGAIWYTRPSRKACGSCHDNIDWTTGDNHPAGPQADDTACADCHRPQGESEFDASIIGAHTIPTKSAQLQGLKIQVVSVSNTAPGSKPTVIFKTTNGDGTAVTPSSLATLNLLIAGPTADYTTTIRQSAKGATASGDAWAYTFTSPIPADATGTWGLSADVYRNVTIDNHTSTGLSVREAAQNPITYFAVTDAQPVARRTVVDLAKCNKCHDQLALHGGQRFKIEECVMCHNPVANDASQRPAAQLPAQTIHFKFMIHRIHTGEELTQDFTVFGFGGSSNNYNEVRFPGDRRDCLACHTTNSYLVPLPDGVLPTATPRDYYSPMEPTAAACLSCHDSKPAAAHAYLSTTTFGEACEVCHGTDAEFAVSKVHAR